MGKKVAPWLLRQRGKKRKSIFQSTKEGGEKRVVGPLRTNAGYEWKGFE